MTCQRQHNSTACVFHSIQDMNSAVITPCSHFFHAGCLKKWLYVQETCPLCHSQLKSQSPTPIAPNQDTPAANQSPAEQDEATANKKQKDDEKEDGTGEQEGDSGCVVSAGETSSGVPSAPHYRKVSSSSSPSPLMSGCNNQSPTGNLSSSSSSFSDTSNMLHTPSSLHHLSSEALAQANMTPAEPGPTPQLNLGVLLDGQESSNGLSSLPEELSPPYSL